MARAQAMKLIYEWEMGGDGGEETRLNLLEVKPNEHEADYMNRMFEGVTANVQAIDGRIAGYLKGWTIDRLTRVDLAILRLAVYELLFDEEIPVKVAINEAVELCKRFGGEDSSSFVNGILGKLVRLKGIQT